MYLRAYGEYMTPVNRGVRATGDSEGRGNMERKLTSPQIVPSACMEQGSMLPLLRVSHVLGSGSNGVVLQCELPLEYADTYPAVPAGLAIAVKVVSHFWSPGSLELLACERDAYRHLPQHYSILRVYAEFMGEIPEAMLRLLSPEMQQVSFWRRSQAWWVPEGPFVQGYAQGFTSTQFYVMECCDDTLYRYRFKLPAPVATSTLICMAWDLLQVLC
jgi:hypothetical protein